MIDLNSSSSSLLQVDRQTFGTVFILSRITLFSVLIITHRHLLLFGFLNNVLYSFSMFSPFFVCIFFPSAVSVGIFDSARMGKELILIGDDDKSGDITYCTD